MESTAFNRDAFYHAAWNVLHSITLHGIHCIHLGSIAPRCMESTAFNQNPLHHTAWNPLHSLEIHWATLHRCYFSLEESKQVQGPFMKVITKETWIPEFWFFEKLVLKMKTMALSY